ncbi:MAG TPA: YkgJ family cysteine cluster protein [Accumulibacter sp.]|jgi:hypothetical protein|nr:YkgJ family cysteine cluster protein [Accumulibacter sp.]HQC79655.1 YkgJ family cysteine cluster protein [Accumulibacter sp.]
MSAGNDEFECCSCGACCASFRVSFYWAELDTRELPETAIEQLTPWHACMAGTNSSSPRCTALQGVVGRRVYCTLYRHRPSPCREVQAGDTQCVKARLNCNLTAPTDLAVNAGE